MRWIRRLPAHLQISRQMQPFTVVSGGGLLRCCAWPRITANPADYARGGLTRCLGCSFCPARRLCLVPPGCWQHGPDFLATLRWFRDPFSRLQRSGGRSPDWFISYRSSQSNEVRAIVDGLTARGHIVWFAEYMIRFLGTRPISTGNRSWHCCESKGDCFAQARTYSSSRYCMNEFRQLVQRVQGGSLVHWLKFNLKVHQTFAVVTRKDLAFCAPHQVFPVGTDGVLQLLPVTSASESRHPNSSTSMPDEDHDLKV